MDTGGAIVPYQTTVQKAVSSVNSKKDIPCLEALLVQLHNFTESSWFKDSEAWENGMPLDTKPVEIVKGHSIKFTKKGITFDDNGVKRELTWEQMGNLTALDPKDVPALLRPDTSNNADAARARAAIAGHIDGLAYALKLPKNVVSLYFPDGKLSTIAERIEHVIITLGRSNQELFAATMQGNDLKKAAKETASAIIDRI